MIGPGWTPKAWRLLAADHPGSSCHFHGTGVGPILELTADSRRIQAPESAVFFALHGPWHDGHHHLEAAHKQGVRRFVVNHLPQNHVAWSGASDVVEVPDVLEFMQAMALEQRVKFNGPVVALTGSNGKTTVKEWIAHLLPASVALHRSPFSHNSQLGVPTSLWSLGTHHDLSLIEAGISMPQEMAKLQRCIAPTEGVFTHLGEAHLGNFDNTRHLAREKCELFRGCRRVYMPASQLHELQDLLECPAVTWGLNGQASNADLQAISSENLGEFQLTWKGNSIQVQLGMHDDVSVHNAMTASLVALHHGATLEDLATQWPLLKPVSGRLSSVKRTQGGVLLQDDTSHDFGALGVALQRLAGLEDDLPRLAILGDIPQSGLHDEIRVDKLAAFLSRAGCQQAWVWCPHWNPQTQSRFAEGAGLVHVKFFNRADALCAAAESLGPAHVLMKLGAGDALAGLKQALAPAEHITTLTINVPAIVDNVRLLKKAAKASRVIAVIKGLGYGTDPVLLGRILEAQGVDSLAVAYAEEGVRLREAGIQTRVLVLNPDPNTFGTMNRHGLEPELVSWPHLQQAHAWAEQADVHAWPIHLKLDTGMRRLGILPEEDAQASALLADGRLKVASVMSHLAAADDCEQDPRTVVQLEAFAKRVSTHFPDSQCHILNTSGAARAHEWIGGRPELAFLRDTVRIGLGMYGLAPQAAKLGLTPALALTSVVSKLVDLPAGQGSGYGWTDAADHDRTLAVVSAGYADGYPRSLGEGQANVGWSGHLMPTVGRICMDMMTVDVTGLEVKPGDPITLWGESPTLEACAKQAHTIPYELLTRIGPRVQRVSER